MTEETCPKMGRPPHTRDEKTAKQVETMAGFGIRDDEIAKVIGLSEPTMRKYYGDELDRGHIVTNVQVAQSLFRMATRKDKPNVSAAIFWLKTRARWVEAQAVEPGKKEQRMETAQTNHQGTSWEDLLNPAPPIQ